MLSAVLRSKTAVKISIQIMQAFVEMKKFITANAGIFQRIDKIEQKQIIENTELYHFGASLKDLGKKWFAFSQMNSLIQDVLIKL